MLINCYLLAITTHCVRVYYIYFVFYIFIALGLFCMYRLFCFALHLLLMYIMHD